MESRLQSNEIRIPKRSIAITSSPSSASSTSSAITSNGNNSTSAIATSYLAINLTSSPNNISSTHLNSSNNITTISTKTNNATAGSIPAIAFSTPNKNQSISNNKTIENLNIKLTTANKNNINNNNSMNNCNGNAIIKEITITKPSNPSQQQQHQLISIQQPPISNNIITSPTSLPDFDLDAPCQYFKSSFARSLSLAGCAATTAVVGGGCSAFQTTNQTKSLDFGINFGLNNRNSSPIAEETTQQILNSQNALPIQTTTTVSSGLIFSTYHENLHYNTMMQQQQQQQQQHQQRNKTNKIMSLTNNDSSACVGNSMDSNNFNTNNEIFNNGATTTVVVNGNSINSSSSSCSPRKMKFLNCNGNNNNNNSNSNNSNLNSNSNVWSTSASSSSTSAASSNVPSCNSTSSLRKQNFNRRSLDSSEIELLRLRKECQNLVEENRRLMGLASGMVRGNLIIPGNSSNIEAVILQTQVDTLQWQLKQVEASREMYRAVMEEVVRFLERCHQNLENFQNQNTHQQQLSSMASSSSSTGTPTLNNNNIRPRSIHQMTYRHNDVNSIIESDSSSIISTATNQSTVATATQPPPTTTTSSSSSLLALNQSSFSSIFSNQNISPRARSSTNLIDANNSATATKIKNNSTISTLDDDNSNISNNILIGESASSAAANNTNTAISHNNFRDFTWRRSPKRQQISQLAASASRDVEKLAEEAFRLLRTAQNLLNTQEPDLTQSKTSNSSDLSFLSNSNSINGSNGILHHHSTLPNGIPSVVIPSSAALKSNSTTNLDTTDPFLITSFARKVNMRESRLSLRSSTDSSVHSTTSSLSKPETDEENNATLQQIQNNKLIITNNNSADQNNKESPVCSSTISSSTTEDESGFSSISSFQEIGLPLHSTIMSSSSILLNNTSSSLSSSNSDEPSGVNKTIIGSNNCSSGESTLILDSRNSTLTSMTSSHHQNLVNGIGLPSSSSSAIHHHHHHHRRWDSAPVIPPRNSLHRFSTVTNNGDEGPTVLWV